MLVATTSHSLHGQQLRNHHHHHHHHHHHITKQGKAWKMEDHRARRHRYAAPYSMPPTTSPSSTMDNSPFLPDDSMLYASPSFAPLPNHPVHVPDYLSYNVNNQLDPSYFTTPQPYLSQPTENNYYTTTTNTHSNQQWLHPSHAQPSSSSHYHNHNPYQDPYDPDLDYDLPQTHSHHSHSPSPTPSSHSASHSSNTKDLTLYGTPSPTHPGAWHCAYPSCTSPALFRRGCDLRKHYNRHRKHLFCRVEGCPQSSPETPGAGFSSKKDRDRHEAKHNPGIACEWAGEGCERVFSRVDNMKDHVRRIHLRV
ncbi:hypothetical protein BDV12DRAFT_210292 [Aspergillus spectabilis]